MSKTDSRGRSASNGAPLFVLSCAAGFLIISGCASYFIITFFL